MSQTTLNLVAVTIFAFVMLSLLGPLFHWSPYIPAAAAFGLLGVATLDTLNWQGKAGTLLVDWVASFSPDHRERVLRHEAGHFLAAYVLEIPVTGYTLSAWEAFRQGQPGQGGVSFESALLEAELQHGLTSQLIDRFCTVWMAGAAAEQLTYGSAQGGGDDRQKLQLLWLQLKRPAAEGVLKQRWAALQAKALLEKHHAAYEALVAAMAQRASVEECQQAIVQHLAEA
ncbi:MAG: ATP-dependent Zn protease [Cyanobacteria bacterium RM1_2_2]|nr:ATP-dependent Zn protease [Cyanobacteria bacterium RM1_2_2]